MYMDTSHLLNLYIVENFRGMKYSRQKDCKNVKWIINKFRNFDFEIKEVVQIS